MSHYTGAVPELQRPADWRAQAACRGLANDVMYPSSNRNEIEKAKSYCRRCPVIETCLEWALDNREDYGVFGGLDEHERWNLRRQRVRNARRPTQKPRGPLLPEARSLSELLTRHTEAPTDGHVMWTGAKTPEFRHRQYTPNRLAYIVDRGREPDGSVYRLCAVKGCVQPAHLADELERAQKFSQAAVLRVVL